MILEGDISVAKGLSVDGMKPEVNCEFRNLRLVALLCNILIVWERVVLGKGGKSFSAKITLSNNW